MKFLIFLLFPVALSAQSFPELIALYEKECSQVVNDTIEQEGIVKYDLVPVKDRNGNILHYALGNADTTWNKPDCPQYKFSDYNSIAISTTWGRDDVLIWDRLDNYPIPSTEKAKKTEVAITRKYVCQVKLRGVEPFSDHFWDWLKARK